MLATSFATSTRIRSGYTTHEAPRRERFDLRSVALFQGLDQSALDLIERHAFARSLPKAANVLQEGVSADQVFVVLSGRVKVFLANEDGKELVLGTLEAGESFGEAALIEGARADANIATLESSRLLIVAREVLSEIAQHDAQFALRVAQRMAQQVQRLSGQVKSLGLCNVYQRLTHVLMGMARADARAEAGTQHVIDQRFTHQELAKRIGASREMVTRIFRDLIVGGYLRVEGRRLIIAKKLPASW
jgi:CRP/FNR family transcriptional regulator, cyclic AMP receptor protein